MKQRRTLKICAASLFTISILALAILYMAYFYHPSENTAYQSNYISSRTTIHAELENYSANYIVEGNGDPVILIHGGGSWLYSYRDNISALAETFEVYALDMPGHGYTASQNEPVYDLDTYTDFINEFMTTNKSKRLPSLDIHGAEDGLFILP